MRESSVTVKPGQLVANNSSLETTRPWARREMPQHAERSMSQIDARAGRVAQFLLPKIKRQIGDLDLLQSFQIA